jgi:hypothetical protein
MVGSARSNKLVASLELLASGSARSKPKRFASCVIPAIAGSCAGTSNRSSDAYGSTVEKTSETLCPPKPIELLMTCLTAARRATFGT